MAQLHFLGTGNAFGQDGRMPSCYLLQVGGKNILLDCGPSTLTALYGVGVAPKLIDLIVISHLHADHVGGLPFFLLDDKWISKRKRPVKVVGPAGTEDLVRRICQVYYSEDEVQHLEKVFEFVSFEPGESVTVDDVAIRGLEAVHSAEARMIFLRAGGRSVGYSGDSALHIESLREILKADITLHECTTFEYPVPNHVNYFQLRDAVLSDLELEPTKKVYLTHVDESMAKNVDSIDHPFLLARDGLVVKF